MVVMDLNTTINNNQSYQIHASTYILTIVHMSFRSGPNMAPVVTPYCLLVNFYIEVTFVM